MHMPAISIGKAAKTTGAGDAMGAGFLSAILAGREPRDALCRGQVFAGHHVGAAGGGYLSSEALDRYCREVR